MEWNAILNVLLGALLGILASTIGAAQKARLDRRSAKKVPKTEARAEAYRDFVVYAVCLADPSSASCALDAAARTAFHEMKARLLLFGEEEVVSAVARFLSRHRTLHTTEAKDDLAKVVRAMRRSLITSSDDKVIRSVRNLIDFGPLDTSARAGEAPPS